MQFPGLSPGASAAIVPQHLLPSMSDKCELLGPFALVIQLFLGVLALSSLVWKRYREYPNRRPWKVWLFDVSKQVIGALGIHMLNVFMSILGGHSDQWVSTLPSQTSRYYFATPARPGPPPSPPHPKPDFDNPCDYYFLNILFDTTIGVPILWGLLHVIFALARNAGIEGIESGQYGNPPRYSYYFKQLALYFIGLVSMKLIIYILLVVCPFLVHIAYWLLSWSDPVPNLQVAFVVLVFPLVMNTFQYYVIDSIIQSPEYSHQHAKSPEEHPESE
ncbi:hypothetical protein KL930_000695 [Ogataea haglerorum]|nr:hypothetical protein KL915_000697 [Ogataea haglerorum]KAG7711480.1 hypothetical protein KL914_000122 [Ogataea haglerorum]KAG7745613.1 hypothetical protein KL932_000643 [Ogataea haglerorum]KAG7781499.1 hypothetical protein KL922_000421 [Ogataea haglerorum]KAG7782233.1 hypothetical protein KL930_000695 [Ogataea haglerorum]